MTLKKRWQENLREKLKERKALLLYLLLGHPERQSLLCLALLFMK